MNQASTAYYEEPMYKKSYILSFIIILGSLSAFGPLTIDMYLPALPTIADELNTSVSMTQLSLTACLIGLAVGQLIMGPLSDIRGRKKPLVFALATYTLASLLCFFTTSIWAFVALRFLQGLGGAAGIVISRATARDLFSGPSLTKFFATLMLVNGLAPIVAPVFGGQLLQVMSWRGVFAVLTAIGGIMLIVVISFLQETLPIEKRKTGGIKEVFLTFGELIKDKTFMGFVLSKGFIMSSMFAYISGSTFVLQDIYGMSAQQFSLVFAINGLGLVLVTQITGRGSKWLKEISMFKYGLFQSIVSSLFLLVVLVLHVSVIWVCVALFFVITSVGIVNTTTFTLTMNNQGDRAGSASALLGLLPFLLGAIVSPLVGIGNGTTALPLGIVIASCASIASVSYWVLGRASTN